MARSPWLATMSALLGILFLERTIMATRSTRTAVEQDAFALLKSDHKTVKALFQSFQEMKEAGDDQQKAELVRQICDELTVHAEVEEEIFYPAVRAAIEDGDLLDEAEVEHATAKDLIAQLNEMEPTDELYDAKVTVLSEYIDHHVKEEEGEIFPKAQKSNLDADALGREMMRWKQELKTALGIDEEALAIRPKRSNGSRASAKSSR